MATATKFSPVTITEIRREDWDGDQVADGQYVVYGAYGFARQEFDKLGEQHPSWVAWDRLMDEVFEELHPKIADLFYEAVERRLPWTWAEGEDR